MDSERFWSGVDLSDDPRQCWPWIRSTNAGGYGQSTPLLGERLSHRISWTLIHGPTRLYVLHECDNPPCCNPAHLFEGTHADNMADMRRKGRTAKGGCVSSAKLTDDEVLQMRALYANGEVTAKDLGPMFGVTGTQAHGVVTGRFWRHLPLVPDMDCAAELREQLRIKRSAETNRKIKGTHEDLALELRRDGMTLLEIGHRVGASKNTVSRYFRNRDGLKGKTQLNQDERAEVLRLLTEGVDALAVAERFGVCRTTVWRISKSRSVRGG